MTDFLAVCAIVFITMLACAAIKGELWECIKSCFIVTVVLILIILAVLWRAIA